MPTSPFVVAYVVGGITFMPTIFLIAYLLHYFHMLWMSLKSRNHSSVNQLLFQYQSIYDDDDDDTSAPNIAHRQPSSSSSYKVGWLRVSLHSQARPPPPVDLSDLVKNMYKAKPKMYLYIFFVVLKQTTLFLYDSERQLDCKGVIQMHTCNVMMHPPGLKDHELFNRPQLIKLVNTQNGTTFYLNCHRPIDKEDWYHVLLGASAAAAAPNGGTDDGMTPNDSLDPVAINHLVTTLHSTPSHLETQWFNALIGRLFCGVHQTDRIRTLLLSKLVSKLKKINQRRPQFLGPITVRSIDPGFAQPYLTQPRLLHLTHKGELLAEAFVDYSGHLKFEIETVFQWQYVEQFKPLQVRIVLAITLQTLKGKLQLKIKAPPTNRMWYGFYSLPEMEWLVEPVVWERRVGYSMVVKAIKTKMEEAVMENTVLPNQDDITFFSTPDARGGIFI